MSISTGLSGLSRTNSFNRVIASAAWMADLGRIPKALRKELADRAAELPPGWRVWPRTRLFTAYVQLRCREEGVNPGAIDGLWAARQTMRSTSFANVSRII